MSVSLFCDGCGDEFLDQSTPYYYVAINHVSGPNTTGKRNLLYVSVPSWPPAGIFHPRCVPERPEPEPEPAASGEFVFGGFVPPWTVDHEQERGE